MTPKPGPQGEQVTKAQKPNDNAQRQNQQGGNARSRRSKRKRLSPSPTHLAHPISLLPRTRTPRRPRRRPRTRRRRPRRRRRTSTASRPRRRTRPNNSNRRRPSPPVSRRKLSNPVPHSLSSLRRLRKAHPGSRRVPSSPRRRIPRARANPRRHKPSLQTSRLRD